MEAEYKILKAGTIAISVPNTGNFPLLFMEAAAEMRLKIDYIESNTDGFNVVLNRCTTDTAFRVCYFLNNN